MTIDFTARWPGDFSGWTKNTGQLYIITGWLKNTDGWPVYSLVVRAYRWGGRRIKLTDGRPQNKAYRWVAAE